MCTVHVRRKKGDIMRKQKETSGRSAALFKATLGLVVLGALLSTAAAQRVEFNPYAGGILAISGTNLDFGSFDLKRDGIYGVRAGFFLTERFEIEGNFGYINHFEFKNSDPKSRGILWEASGLYRFDLEKVKPFVAFGVGGLTAVVDEDRPSFAEGATPVFGDNDTFFTFSYGGGVKVPMLWGPLGLRADARGRTIPNLLGQGTSWLELTGGITLTF
jgi:opacity protein-like surface antigen